MLSISAVCITQDPVEQTAYRQVLDAISCRKVHKDSDGVVYGMLRFAENTVFGRPDVSFRDA